ncbi:hypothetical protein [Lacibacter sp. H407]|uniref:hypothetical protein n=1 Tax=Lacibacter sp. H407 TaxID=3133423 RepID=UPI0030C29F37
MSKKAKLDDIFRCCENRFNRGASIHWKHGDFSDLSREILRDTNVNISPSTLKRIFGKVSVDDDYIPQQATVDALKKYGNFTELENAQQAPPSFLQPNALNKESFKRYKLLLPIVALSIVILALLTWRYWKPKSMSGSIKITRTEGLLPATVVFELQLPDTKDSLFVNFGDKSPLLYIKPGEKSTGHIYYIPGVFNASLQTRQQTFATTSAYIKSDNWIAFGCHRQDDIPVHFYALPVVKTGSDSLFNVTNNKLFQLGLDTTGPVLTRLSNYTPVNQTADDFIFETTFKNHIQEKGIFCRSTQFQISGSNSMIRFRWVNAGCSQRVLNIVSEQIFKGATNDLSQFVLDLSQWTTVKLVNHQKQVSLYVNGKQIFTGSYQKSLGNISGLFLEFEGTGVVKTCELKSYDGNTIYRF